MCRFPKVIETPRGHKQFLLVGTSTKVLVICVLASSDLSVGINIGAPLYCLQIITAPAMHKSKWLHAGPSVDFLKLSPFFNGQVDMVEWIRRSHATSFFISSKPTICQYQYCF